MPLLQEAFNIALEASRQSNEALRNVGIVDDILRQIQVLKFITSHVMHNSKNYSWLF